MAAMLERIEKPGMTAHVAFLQQLGQVFLGSSSRAGDGAVVVAPFAGLAVAAEEDAHEPPVPPASHNLSRLANQRSSSRKSGTRLAHWCRPRTLAISWKMASRMETTPGVAGNLFSSGLYPQPLNGDLLNNSVNTTRSYNNVDQGDVRVDYKNSPSDRLYGRISEGSQDNPVINSFRLLFDTFSQARLENGVINWTHNFSPNVLSEAVVGVNYVRLNQGGVDNGFGNLGEKLGIANANDHGPGLLAINIFGGAGIFFGNQNIGTAELFADTVFQYKEDLVITHHRHLFHAGFQYWRQRINTYEAGTNGRTGFMNFAGRFTAGPDQLTVAGGGTGAGEADFFLGLPDSFGRGINSTGPWGQRANVFGIYFQDDWRATDTLTLNLGSRYENHSPWVEVQNRQVNFAPITGQIQFAGQPCIYSNCRGLYNSYNGGLDFQPRIGFAWSPSFFGRKTVLRGAYTISSYLEGTGNNLRLHRNPPLPGPP